MAISAADRLAKRRLSIAGASGIAVELINKLAPFLIYHLAEQRLGVEKFGQSMVGVSLIEMLLPFVVFGYAHHGTVQVAQVEKHVQGRERVVSDLLMLRFLHLMVVFAVGGIIWTFNFPYAHVMPLLAALSFVLVSGAYELVWFEVATQRVVHLNVMIMSSRFSSLLLVYLFVQSPADYIWFAVLSLFSVFMVNTLAFLDVTRRISLCKPSWTRMRQHFQQSRQYALLMILLIIMERLDILIAEQLYGSAGAGLFVGPARIGHSLIQVASALTTAFFAEMIILQHQEKLQQHLELALWMMVAFWSPIVVGSLFVGDELLVFVFSENYRSMGPILSWVILGGAASAINASLGMQVLIVLGRIRFWLRALLVGVLVCGGLGWWLGNLYGLLGLAQAIVLTKLGLLATVAGYVRYTCVVFAIRPLIFAAVPALMMGVALAMLPQLGLWSTIFTGAFIYFGSGAILFRQRMTSFLRLLK
ncbi:MAG: hypothetical protein OXT67_05315 [Zetaproteobacteria bacterium]|nr:hypothetical protein [Zetaproteobacteria bacterium]